MRESTVQYFHKIKGYFCNNCVGIDCTDNRKLGCIRFFIIHASLASSIEETSNG